MPEPGQQTIVIWPDGTVVVPDLADGLQGLSDIGPLPWQLGRHQRADLAARAVQARELLGPTCLLCARRCAVDRRRGERGFCGLGAEVSWAPETLLWGEEPELGRPGLALAPLGCGLRCAFCYRPEWLDSTNNPHPSPRREQGGSEKSVAPCTGGRQGGLDAAVHLHLLGGNPDESLPFVIEMLAARQDPRPVVWNTHAYVTPEGAALLEGVADAIVADLKFGPGRCASELAGVSDYWQHATASLALWATLNVDLLVRHVALPGHIECCARPVAAWMAEHLPAVTFRILEQYEPWGRAWQIPGLARRLDEAERAALATLKG
ncbi:MAG: hypothetical protein HZB16_02755 [Armatimonadetes bacterium]|nr:hypothetical protein [Armatimonadota bacterium]